MNTYYSNISAMKSALKRSFSIGVGSVLSLQGNYIKIPDYQMPSDSERIRGDWERVGRQLRYAAQNLTSQSHF